MKDLIYRAQKKIFLEHGIICDLSLLDRDDLEKILQSKTKETPATYAGFRDSILSYNETPIASFEKNIDGRRNLYKLKIDDFQSGLNKDIKKQIKEKKLLEKEIKELKEKISILSIENTALRKTENPIKKYETNYDKILSGIYIDCYEKINSLIARALNSDQTSGGIDDFIGPTNQQFRTYLIKITRELLLSIESIGVKTRISLDHVFYSEPNEAFEIIFTGIFEKESNENHLKEKIYKNKLFSVSDTIEHDNSLEYKLYQTIEFPINEYIYQYKKNKTTNTIEYIECTGLNKIIKSTEGRKENSLDEYLKDSKKINLKISINECSILTPNDNIHLLYFITELFEAISRCSPNRPRGALREQLMICNMLAFSAPCSPYNIYRTTFPEKKIKQGKKTNYRIKKLNGYEVILNYNNALFGTKNTYG